MVVCEFYLKGWCKFGDQCWNEHPRDERQQGQAAAPSSKRKSSGQRYADRGSRQITAMEIEDHARGDGGPDTERSTLSDILQDLNTWESSGQWLFSVYCVLKEQQHLSGFTDRSPEELRLECYKAHSEGNLQNYSTHPPHKRQSFRPPASGRYQATGSRDHVSSVQQLVHQWKQRALEIRNWNPPSTSALLNQLTKPTLSWFEEPQQSGSFGGLQQSGFGTSSTSGNKTATAANFTFKLDTPAAPTNAGATTGTSGFGLGTSGTPSTPGTSLFGQGVTVSSTSSTAGSSGADTMLSSALFTP